MPYHDDCAQVAWFCEAPEQSRCAIPIIISRAESPIVNRASVQPVSAARQKPQTWPAAGLMDRELS